MITKIPHQVTGRGPADTTLAVSIAAELHPHVPAPRAPEAATTPAPRAPEIAAYPVPELMGLRTSAARPHRRRVPLKRLNTLRGLTTAGV
ncbi:hypothetical protein ACGFX8_08455 [Streptomyces sp. NPDC048362]|uniref:hypothetical protein n=1 Tax=unclassified Streptomyces TaxID=2593676 RepID=UPI0033C9C347